MRYPSLVGGTLRRRYKRFLADVQLDDGREVVAHCPNTGSMRAVNVPGCRVWLAPSDNPQRKLAWTWELIELPEPEGGVALASVHTGRTNRIVAEALQAQRIAALAGAGSWQAEARVEGSRLDFRRPGPSGIDTFVEVKQVTLRETDGYGYFPDAVSERGRRHLEALASLAARGHRAVLLFCVAHEGIADVAPADHLDPAYGETLRRVAGQGVEVLAHGVRVARGADAVPEDISLAAALPVRLHGV